MSAGVNSPPKALAQAFMPETFKRSWEGAAHMLMAECDLGRVTQRDDFLTPRHLCPLRHRTLLAATFALPAEEVWDGDVPLPPGQREKLLRYFEL